jgi:SAM-dependent methyltransferase
VLRDGCSRGAAVKTELAERYDEAAAAHYSAYRPPLHSLILGKVLQKDRSTAVGLDVGCGTGHSAIALARYCAKAHAFDASPLMLARTAKDGRITYFAAGVEQLPIRNGTVDLVTLAGSLFYADRDTAGVEIRRVCSRNAEVIVYDFEILLDEILQRCSIDPQAAGSSYDHAANFSGDPGFAEVIVKKERLGIEMSALELTHVLLSDSNRLDQFVNKYLNADPSDSLERDLRSAADRLSVEADIYYSKYRVAASS